MHAILCSWFNVVKVLPLHEVKHATAVKVVRYGYPYIRIHRIFDFPIRFANRLLDPQRSFFGGIVKRPNKIAGCVDPMSGLITAGVALLVT